MATELAWSLRRLEQLRLKVLQMESKTMSEIRSYRTPPHVVHKVMIASFLLLGEDEETTSVSSSISI